jgi:hypothetical protein
MTRAGVPLLLPMLEQVGIRMVPMNRQHPDRWHSTYMGDCPRCHRENTLFVERGGTEFTTTCCGERGGWVVLARLLLVPA